MKFAVIVLIILALVSVICLFIGEFYPVKAGGPGWEEMWRKQLGWSKPVFDLFIFFKLHDPFRSWWFQTLLILLSLSLLACIIERLPIVIRSLRSSEPRDADAILKSPLNESFTARGKPEEVLKRIPGGFRYIRQKSGEEWRLTGSFASFAKIGPILAHTGLLCLALGGLIGSWLGFATQIGGLPGDIVNDPALTFQARVDSFRIEYYPLGIGQWVVVDDAFMGKIIEKGKDNHFTVETEASHGKETRTMEIEGSRLRNQYDINMDRGNIKDYITQLTVLENGKEMVTQKVRVNHPLRYKGFRFYQTSFDPDNPRVEATVDSAIIVIYALDGKTVIDTITVEGDKPSSLPDGTQLQLTRFLPDFRMGEGAPTSASAQMRNPAVQLEVTKDSQKQYHQWSFLKNPFMHTAQNATYSFQVTDIYGAKANLTYPTVLEVKKTPGTELIWLGFILVSIGMMLSFYVLPQRIWLVIRQSGSEKSEVIMAAHCQKSHDAFQHKFEGWVETIKG
jgi:cytochrome c biogenesis protein